MCALSRDQIPCLLFSKEKLLQIIPFPMTFIAKHWLWGSAKVLLNSDTGVVRVKRTPEPHKAYHALRNVSNRTMDKNLKNTICSLCFWHTCDLETGQGHLGIILKNTNTHTQKDDFQKKLCQGSGGLQRLPDGVKGQDPVLGSRAVEFTVIYSLLKHPLEALRVN